MPAGFYEHLLTTELHGRLGSLDDVLIQQDLDPADAHEALTRHIAQITDRALRGLSGNDRLAVSRQVDLANRIVKAITALAPAAAAAEDAEVDPALFPPGDGMSWRKPDGPCSSSPAR